MHIILLRHAESARNEVLHNGHDHLLHTVTKDSSITLRGRQQARACTEILETFELQWDTEFWCSTLKRTGETLRAAGIHESKIQYNDGLNEWYKDGDENIADFFVRVDALINRLMDTYISDPNKLIVIAGHSLFFSVLISRLFDSVKMIAEFPNCSLSSLQIKDGKFAIYNLGDVSHIPEEIQTGVHKPWSLGFTFDITRSEKPIEIKGDLLDQQGYLVQQCNCVTVKAHGLSQAFIDRFGPTADLYGKRSKRSANTAAKPSKPGTYDVVPLNDNQIMVGLYGQWLPGKPNKWSNAYSTLPDTPDSYEDRLGYFKRALTKFSRDLACDDTPVYFPYRIGCGLAGGNWTKYKEAIEEFAAGYHGKTYIVRMD